jgi:IclR family transcriptional regulator, acetate operon repressor
MATTQDDSSTLEGANGRVLPVVGRSRDPLSRGIQLLTMMVDAGAESYGVRQVAKMLSVSPSTAHRLLVDLEALGMVARLPDGQYRLGLEFHRLAWRSTARFPLRELAREVLDALARDTGESSFLGVYDRQRRQMMFAAYVESAHPLRYAVDLNTWLPVHAGASGLAILASLPENERHEIVHERPLDAVTDRTLAAPEELDAALATVRRQGYAVSHGQRFAEATALAAPVFDGSGVVVGDIGISIPTSRFEPSAESDLAVRVRRAADELTARVGGRPARD